VFHDLATSVPMFRKNGKIFSISDILTVFRPFYSEKFFSRKVWNIGTALFSSFKDSLQNPGVFGNENEPETKKDYVEHSK
jgi:hypothetical protein